MVGPDYVRPTAPTPAAYKEAEGWKVAQPADDVPRGEWWEAFNDPELNALEAQVDVSNQTIAAAEARVRQATAGHATPRARRCSRSSTSARAAVRNNSQTDSSSGRSHQQRVQPRARRELGARPVGRHPAQHRSQQARARRRARPISPTRGCRCRRRWRRPTF